MSFTSFVATSSSKYQTERVISYVMYTHNEHETSFSSQNDEELKPGKRYMMHSQGRKRSLLIQKCTYEDQGVYVCKTTDDNTSAKLTVHGREEQLFICYLTSHV